MHHSYPVCSAISDGCSGRVSRINESLGRCEVIRHASRGCGHKEQVVDDRVPCMQGESITAVHCCVVQALVYVQQSHYHDLLVILISSFDTLGFCCVSLRLGAF
jgi:hypothetical protein